MNFINLKFHQPNIEQLYQEHLQKHLRIPTFKYYSILILILVTTQVLKYSIVVDWFQLILNLGALLYILLQLIITCQWELQKYSITILNIFISIVHMFSEEVESNHYCLMKGHHQMASTIILMISTDFVNGIGQLLSILTIRIIFIIVSSMYVDYEQLAYALVYTLALIAMLYLVNLNNRRTFQSSLNVSQLEYIVPKIVKEPFFQFNFNFEQFKFQLLLNQESKQLQEDAQQTEFKQFLRSNMVDNITTLENYIYYRIQNKQVYTNQMDQISITITNNNIKQEILYSEMMTPELTYLIVFKDNRDKQLLESKLQYQKEFFNSMRSFAKQVSTIARRGLISDAAQAFHQIIWMTLTFTKASNIIRSKQTTKQEIVNFEHHLKKYVTLFQHSQNIIRIRLFIQSSKSSVEHYRYTFQANTILVQKFILEILQLTYQCTLNYTHYNNTKQITIRLFQKNTESDSFYLSIRNINMNIYRSSIQSDEFELLKGQLRCNQTTDFNGVVFKFPMT